MSTIEERIIEIRKNANLSQTEFAESLGVGRGVITNLERGLTELKPQFCSLICEKYHVNKTWLETGDGEMFKTPSIDEEIAELVGKAMSPGTDPVYRRVLLALARTDESVWQKAKEFLQNLKDAEERENK